MDDEKRLRTLLSEIYEFRSDAERVSAVWLAIWPLAPDTPEFYRLELETDLFGWHFERGASHRHGSTARRTDAGAVHGFHLRRPVASGHLSRRSPARRRIVEQPYGQWGALGPWCIPRETGLLRLCEWRSREAARFQRGRALGL